MSIDWNQPWQPVFCLRLSVLGAYYYVATEPIVLIDADNNEYPHVSGLQPLDWTYSVEIGQFSSQSKSVGIQFTNPLGEDFNHTTTCWALDVSSMEGELSLYVNGLYEDRIILASGRLQRIKWGHEGFPIEASLQVNPFQRKALIPPKINRISASTFPGAAEDVYGAGYPIIFGTPGNDSTPSHPAPRISPTRVLIAGHHVSATTCNIWNRTTGVTTTASVYNEMDAEDNPIALAGYSAAEGDEVWVGGLSGNQTNTADIIANVLDLSGISYKSVVGLRGPLENYPIGFVLNEQCEAWPMLQDRLLKLLPLTSQIVDGDQVEFSHVKSLPTQADVVYALDAQRGDCTALDFPEIDERDLANKITIRYNPDPSLSGVDKSLVITGLSESGGVFGTQTINPDASIELSQARYGVFADEISTDCVWSNSVAGRIAYDRFELFGYPSISITYDILPRFGNLRAGDVISLTDSDYNWTDKLFRVIDQTYSLGGITAALRSIEHPSQMVVQGCAAASFPAEPGGAVFGVIAAGDLHSLFVKNDATTWGCGENSLGEIGDGTTTMRTSPTQSGSGVSGFSAITKTAAGSNHSLALKSDGTVWSWGFNGLGQLGDGTTTDTESPAQIPSFPGVVWIAAGGYTSLAIKSDGTVWGWGFNSSGQLGDNSTTDRLTPIQVKDSAGTGFLSGFISCSTGGSHTLALKSDGTVWGWGYNASGQLGDNSTADRLLPVKVKDSAGTGFLSDIIAIAAGSNHSLALKSDGTVLSWGLNTNGQLGDGTTTQRHLPVQIGVSAVIAIATSADHSLALKSDGTVLSWGLNTNGQLGDGTTTQRNAPVQAGGAFAGCISIVCGLRHSLAELDDGSIAACGYNSNGELGDGTTTQRLTPVSTGFSLN